MPIPLRPSRRDNAPPATGEAEPSPPGCTARQLVMVGVVALAVRLVFCFALVPLLGLPVGPAEPEFFMSTDGYGELARNLLNVGTLTFSPSAPPTVFRGPVFPVVLAAALWVLGDVGRSVLIVNCVASSLTAVLALTIAARRLTSTPWLVRYAAVLLPLSIYHCSSGFADTFVAFTIVLCIAAADALLRSPGPRLAAVAGAAFAVTLLTKPIMQLFPLLFVPFALSRGRRCGIWALASVLIGSALVGPWVWRNDRLAGEFVGLNTGSGFNMLVGNYLVEESGDCDRAFKFATRRALADLSREIGRPVDFEELRTGGYYDVPPELDRVCRRLAMKQIADSPWLLIRKTAINAIRFWYFSSSPAKTLVAAAMNGLCLSWAAIGLWQARLRRRSEAAFLLLALAYYVAIYCVLIVHSTRYTLPVLIIMAPFVGITLDRWLRAEPAAGREKSAAG